MRTTAEIQKAIATRKNSLRKAGDASAAGAGGDEMAAGERMSRAFDEALTRIALKRSLSAHQGENALAA